MNAEFQRIAKREKKAFLSDQCREIEENNRMGKTRDLFKKIRDTKGTLHAKMGTTKDRNSMDLTEAEDIKKRWQKDTEEIKKEIKIFIEMNENENTTTPKLWDSVKSVLRGRFIAIQAYLKKQEKSQINNLTTPKTTRKGRNEEPQG